MCHEVYSNTEGSKVSNRIWNSLMFMDIDDTNLLIGHIWSGMLYMFQE